MKWWLKMKRSSIFLLCILAVATCAQAPVVTIDCAPGTVSSTTLPDGRIQIKCQPVATPVPAPSPPIGLIVAPDGKPSGAGTLSDPRDLQSAIAAASPMKSGNVYLRGGKYVGPFVSTLAAPVTVRAYPGEKPVLVCGGPDQNQPVLTVQGSQTIWRDFEVHCPTADRSKPIGPGVNALASGSKFINLMIHDCGGGFGFWTPAVDAEVYGCIIYHNGWQGADPDRGHGHGIYTQNETGKKLIGENIVFDQYGWGLHAYTEGGFIKGFDVWGNALFNNGSASREGSHANILVGGMKPAERVSIMENFTYHGGAQMLNIELPFGKAANLDLNLTGNYFIGGVTALGKNWATVNAQGNVIVGQLQVPAPLPVGWTVANNATVIKLDKVFVRPNKYEEGRANVIVYNGSRAASVAVDLSNTLKSGDKFELYEIHNLSKPLLSGSYSGIIQVPVQGEFGCFVVRRL